MRLIIEMETNEFLNVIKHLASKIANADMPPWAKAASDTLAKSKVASPKEIAPKKEAKVKPKQIESSLSKAGRPRGRPTTVSEQDFIAVWKSCRSLSAVAKRLGMKASAVSGRATRLRKRGIKLKKFHSGANKKRKTHDWTVEQANWLLKRVKLDARGNLTYQNAKLLTEAFNGFWKTRLTVSSITGKVNRLLK